MLTPKELYDIPDSMVELYSQAEADIIADMARRLSTYDYFIPSAEWQYKKAIEMGLVHDEILKRLSEDTGKSEAELTKLMNEAGVKAIKADDKIYKKAGLSPAPLKSSYALRGILQTGLIQTKNTFANLTRTTAVAGSRQFEIALDNAYMQIISGAFDSNTAIRNSIEVLAKQGLCSITYASGKVDTIETAVRRAVLTGVNITCGKMQEARADEMGCDLVEVTAHEGARPAHALWQGRIFSRSGTHPKYPDFKSSTGFGTGAGLCGWNCRHSFFPFFENSSEPAYTDEELEGYREPKYEYNGEMLTHYEASQKQRQIERNIRRWKREELAMETAGLDSSKAHEKVRAWQAKQRDFIRQTGLKRQYDREQIGKVVDEKGNIKPNVPQKELPLTDKHKEAIEYYVSGDGMYINDYLRNRNNPIERMGEMRKEDRVLIEDLSNATNRKHDNSVLYRSIDATAVFGDISENDWESLQAKLIYNIDDKTTAKVQSLIDKTKGKKIIDKGFMSTTKDYNVAADFGDFTGSDKPIVIEFTNANKVKGFDVEKHLPNLEKRMEQSEVLLHNNSKYTVKDIIVRTDEYGKHIHVIAEFDDIEEIVPNTKKDVWKNADNGKTFTTKKDAFQYFKDERIDISDSRKYPMDENIATGIAEWHNKFIKNYDSFNNAIINKLPEIKNVAPSSLSYGTLGQFSYYSNGKVVGIKLNSGLHYSLEHARKIAESSTMNGWHSGKNPLHTFIHEYGHYVSHSMDGLDKGFEHKIIQATVDEYKKVHPEYTYSNYIGLKDALSKYGTTNESECFAEAFAEYFGEDNPREFASIFGELLEKELKGVK